MESMEGSALAQATGRNNEIVEVYQDQIQVHSGWQSHQTDTLDPKDVSLVSIKGMVNCTLSIQTNTGREYRIECLALPEAREIKSAIESQKQRAGLYE